MNKWSEKQKQAMRIIGVTGAVYLSFRFLLPLFSPVLLGWMLGLGLNPGARWLREHWRVPAGVGAAVLVAGVLVLVGTALLWGTREIVLQARALATKLPYYMGYFNAWMENCCCQIERVLELPDGVVLQNVTSIAARTGARLRETGMELVVDQSLPAVKGLGDAAAWAAVFLVSAVFVAKDWPELREKLERSTFGAECTRIGGRLSEMGRAYVRSEMTIFFAVASVSATGLWVLGSPYTLLGALGIAAVDLLPIFGSGTVYVPWAIVCLLQGRYGRAAVVAILYLLCYFLRSTIEAHKMGGRLGFHPLVTLAAAYVGWALFGVAGFVLGPVGLVLIAEFCA